MTARGWLAQELLRHARRRIAGITTVSVVVGEPQQVLHELAEAGTRVITTRADVAREMAVDFLARAASPLLRDEALGLLASSDVQSDWQHKSSTERALWLENVQSKPLTVDSAFAVQWLQTTQSTSHADPIEQAALLTQWRPESELPTLASWGPPKVLAQAVLLAEAAPKLAMVFLVSAQSANETLNAQTPRVRALLQDSILRPPAPANSHVQAPQLAAPSVAAGSIQTTRRTRNDDDDAAASDAVRQALGEPVLQQLREDASRSQQIARDASAKANPEAAQLEDRARSMVERFLYQLLQRSPATRDVFELNAQLPFRFGARLLEADFAARSLRLVLEVDGYFHFTNFDAYRRDRRKDLVLQQHEYMVARFLADDVLERTADVLGQIEQLVTSRKKQKED